MAKRRSKKNHVEESVIILSPHNKRKSKQSSPKVPKKRKSNVNSKLTRLRRSVRIQAQKVKKFINILNNSTKYVQKKSMTNRSVQTDINNLTTYPRRRSKTTQTKRRKDEDVIVINDDDDDDVIIINDECDTLISNIYNVKPIKKDGLREIVIDGSSVALRSTGNELFSVERLKQTIDYFLKRGHKVKAFVPQFRLKFKNSTNQKLLNTLVKNNSVVITPSRFVKGKLIASHEGRYIIQYATHCDGIIVSNDNFKDIVYENSEWCKTIATRLLIPTWHNNKLSFKRGPCDSSLNTFLSFP